MHITPNRVVLSDIKLEAYFPFGKARSKNVLKDLDCSRAMRYIKVMFLSCGDLHKALQTTASQLTCRSIFQYHICENSVLNIARDVLILKIVSSPLFDPNDHNDIGYLWSVWYETVWSSQVSKRFKEDVEDLIGGNIPENIKLFPDPKCQQSLTAVWREWFSNISAGPPEHSFITKIISQRKSATSEGWFSELKNHEGIQELDVELVQLLCAYMQIEPFQAKSGVKVVFELMNYYYPDLLTPSPRKKGSFINPTLLELKTRSWRVHFQVSPFNGYLPVLISQLNEESDQPFQDYCRDILKQYILAYRQRAKKVEWTFHLSDPLEVCYTIPEEFHVIDCGDLVDQLGLANMVNAVTRSLSQEPESKLLMETTKWSSYASTPTCFVEEALCAPLTMLPSIYGLRLGSPIDVGASRPPYPKASLNLTWMRTSSFENLRPDIMSTLGECLSTLATKCFRLQGAQEADSTKFYTPLTWLYVFNYACERLGRGYDTKIVDGFSERFDVCFREMWRTLHHWTWFSKSLFISDYLGFDEEKKNRIVHHLSQYPTAQLLSINIPYDRVRKDTLEGIRSFFNRFPVLRLVLLPSLYYEDLAMNKPFDISCTHDVHFIDNIHISQTKTYDCTIGMLQVSFALISDHGLSRTHSGIIVDFQTGLPLIPLGPVKSFQVEPFTQVHPFADSGPSLPDEFSQLEVTAPSMTVVSCMETKLHYEVHIACNYLGRVEGFSWVTDQQPPCESAHRITFTISQPCDMRPLTIGVPYPFDAKRVTCVPGRPQHGQLQILLQKAVYEPWPAQFTNRSDCIGEHLEQQTYSNPFKMLTIQLEQQFDVATNMPPAEETSPLKQVRLLIASILEIAVKGHQGKHSFVTVRFVDRDTLKNTRTTEADWYLRLFPPLLYENDQVPILKLSAFDRQLALRLIAKGESSCQEIQNEFDKCFPDDARHPMPLLVSSNEVGQLFRYILRLNSLRLSSSNPPQTSEPSGGPWLLTFLSPLYSYQPPLIPQIEQQWKASITCTYCKSVSQKLKRCTCCKLAAYCDDTCQQKDSSNHKIMLLASSLVM